jgi:hypothetical protein
MALYNKSKKITDYYLVDIDVEQQEIEVDWSAGGCRCSSGGVVRAVTPREGGRATRVTDQGCRRWGNVEPYVDVAGDGEGGRRPAASRTTGRRRRREWGGQFCEDVGAGRCGRRVCGGCGAEVGDGDGRRQGGDGRRRLATDRVPSVGEVRRVGWAGVGPRGSRYIRIVKLQKYP